MFLNNALDCDHLQQQYTLISKPMAEEEENIQPVRFIYNMTPNTKVLQGRSVIPAAFHYTPRETMDIPRLQYMPISCQCEAVFNPYCPINFNQKSVRCCICGTNSPLPSNYAQHINPQKLPYEFLPKNSTLQFKTNSKTNTYKPSYIFVVDINLQQKELSAIKEQIISVINNLPENYHIGLITFGRNVKVYELASKINTNYCINGIKEYSLGNVMELLGVSVKNDPNSQNSQIVKRFVVPVSTFRSVITSRVRNLRPQNHIYVNQRKHSCFGQALSISIAMAEVSTISTRIVFLVGNPCTVGAGMTIGTDWKQQMRSPKQLSQGQNIKYFVSAKKYYDSFIKRVVARNVILDLFIFTCNEIGFSEMSQLFVSSGGFIVMNQEFSDRVFRDSFPKVWIYLPQIFQNINSQNDDSQIICDTQAVMFVFCSKEVAINGALGQCYSLNKSKPFVSSKVVGKGNTNCWYLGSVDHFKTITVVYQTKQAEAKEQYFYIQLKTIFRNSQGELITRVTTVQRQWAANTQLIVEGFDQQAAAVYLGRHCVNKMLYQQQKNIKSIVDRTLIKWAQMYANYAKGDQSSFQLPPQMKRLPQLCFNLRRSHFINRFGISLDESFFKGICMNRQSVVNCLSMIQPALLAYSLNYENTQPVSVPLDEQEMKTDVILLIDTYFHIAEWYGATCQSWKESNYHEEEGYEHIAELFDSPKIDIDELMKFRFPVSRFYHIFPYASKERILKSRVNPLKGQGQQHQNMITDDTDLRTFTQHLIKAVVNQS